MKPCAGVFYKAHDYLVPPFSQLATGMTTSTIMQVQGAIYNDVRKDITGQTHPIDFSARQLPTSCHELLRIQSTNIKKGGMEFSSTSSSAHLDIIVQINRRVMATTWAFMRILSPKRLLVSEIEASPQRWSIRCAARSDDSSVSTKAIVHPFLLDIFPLFSIANGIE